MDILEGVHRGRYRRCARCAVDLNEESTGISGQKGRPSTCSSRQRRATSGAKCPKFQSKQDFLSGNLIVAWHLRSRLSMLFSCLFVCLFSRHMECATYFFVAEARQLLVGDLIDLLISVSVTKPRSSSWLTVVHVMLSPLPFIE